MTFWHHLRTWWRDRRHALRLYRLGTIPAYQSSRFDRYADPR